MKLLITAILFLFIFLAAFIQDADAQSYFKGPALIQTPTATATAAGTTTLTKDSQTVQIFTGSSTQTVKLPDATTLPLGRSFYITNRSSGAVTVNYNDSSLAASLPANSQKNFIVRNIGSTNGTWDISTTNAGDITGILPVANGGTGTGTQFTLGSIVFAGASGVYTQNNANLFWDNTNNRLGINTSAAPSATFDVHTSAINQAMQGTYTGAQGVSGGASVGVYADPGAALTSGSRMGFFGLGGSFDASHTLSNSSAIQGFTTENWSSTAKGSKIAFYVTPNTTSGVQVGMTLDQDKSLTVVGALSAASASFTSPLPIASGGTNSATALNNNRVMQSSGGSIVEASAITAARALISDANGIPTHSTVTSTQLGYLSTLTVNAGAAIYSSSTGIVANTPGTTGQALLSGGTGAPTWGTLAIANGGTGQTTKAAAFDALSPMTTAGDIIYGGVSGTGTRLAGGTVGQVLFYGSSAPQWQTAPQYKFQVVTSGTTWTSPSGVTSNTIFKFTLIGGGGGGGGAQGAWASGGGGNSGAIGVLYISGLSASTGYTIQIGAAGSGGAAAAGNGTAGTATTLTIGGTTYTASGGDFGLGGSNTTSVNYVCPNSGPATASNFTINGVGNAGGCGICYGSGIPLGGYGGLSPIFGGSTGSTPLGTAGGAAMTYGAGGGGGSSGNATGRAGGNGFQGIMIVEWVQ